MLLKVLPILFFLPMWVNSQKKEDISFSLEYSLSSSKMSMVREYLADTNYFNSYNFVNYPTNTLSKTQGIGFEIGFQPLNFQDLSIGINYNFCGLKRVPVLMIDNPQNPNQTLNYEGDYRLKISTFNFLLGSKTYFNKLFRFEDNNSQFSKRIILAAEYKLGFSVSKISQEQSFKNPYQYYLSQSYKSYDLNGQFNLLFGYRLNEGSIISSINFIMGYLFFATETVKDKSTSTFNHIIEDESNPMKLDFSGLNFGIQLTLRK